MLFRIWCESWGNESYLFRFCDLESSPQQAIFVSQLIFGEKSCLSVYYPFFAGNRYLNLSVTIGSRPPRTGLDVLHSYFS